jgi:uncharacterized protein YutE (UPF0331/DUF86 family)
MARLGRLVERAEREQLVSSRDAERLKAGAEFRNRLLHSSGQVAMTPGIAEGILRASHEAVAKLFK